EETCGGDPCAAVREALADGVRMKVHVVGFDVTPKEAEQLKCIAEAGHGKDFKAANAAELGKDFAQGKQEGEPPGVQKQDVPKQQQPQSPGQPKQMNLLDAKNGGQVFMAPDDFWLETIDGKEDAAGKKGMYVHLFRLGEEAVFAFKDERPATF